VIVDFPGAKVGMAVAIGTAAAAMMPASTARRGLSLRHCPILCWGLEPGRKTESVYSARQLCYHSAMGNSTYDNIAKPVRKRSAKTGKLVGVRLQSEQIKAIDAWAAMQIPPVTRPEAIRGMIDAMLHILAKDPGEKPAKKAKTR
jgi:hypothetical protein